MTHDEQDDLWQLLGKARSREVSTYFARNVVRASREVRQAGRWGAPEMWRTLLRFWQIPAMAACALAIAGGTLWTRPAQHRGSQEQAQMLAMAKSVSQSPDFGVIGNLDELLDSERNSVWLSADY